MALILSGKGAGYKIGQVYINYSSYCTVYDFETGTYLAKDQNRSASQIINTDVFDNTSGYANPTVKVAGKYLITNGGTTGDYASARVETLAANTVVNGTGLTIVQLIE